jgi:hypothetical protein
LVEDQVLVHTTVSGIKSGPPLQSVGPLPPAADGNASRAHLVCPG